MSRDPFEIQLLCHRDGFCDLQVRIAPAAVQAAFDRVFHEAVARAQADVSIRERFATPSDQPVAPETVFAAMGERVIFSVERSLVDWSLALAKAQLDLAFVDQPVVTAAPLVPGQPAVLRLRCFLAPQIPASILAGLTVSREVSEPTGEKVEATLRQLRRAAAATGEPEANRGARLGDRLQVDLMAQLSAGISTLAGVLVDLDAEHEPPALVEALVGATPGQQLTFTCALRVGEHRQEIEVDAMVHRVYPLTLPPLDDRLAAHYGLPTAASLRRFAHESERERLGTLEDARILGIVTGHVNEKLEVKVPEELARRRFTLELQRVFGERQGLGIEEREIGFEDIEKEFQRARTAVEGLERQSLVAAGLARSLGVGFSPEEFHVWVRERACRFGFDAEVGTPLAVQPSQLGVLRRRLLHRRLVERLVAP